MRLNAREHGKIVEGVYYNDRNITNMCFEVDTDEHWVKMWIVNDKGERDCVQMFGRVKVILTPDAQGLIDIGGQLQRS